MTDYYAIEEMLVADGVPYAPAELHGQLMGWLIVGGASFSFESWLTSLAEEVATERDISEWRSAPILAHWCASILQDLRNQTEAQILLPEDEVDLRDRVEALGAWVGGFLIGLALGGLRSQDMDMELREVLEDLQRISQVDTEFTVDEDAEKHAMELIEYVRIAVYHLMETDRARRQWIESVPTPRAPNAQVH